MLRVATSCDYATWQMTGWSSSEYFSGFSRWNCMQRAQVHVACGTAAVLPGTPRYSPVLTGTPEVLHLAHAMCPSQLQQCCIVHDGILQSIDRPQCHGHTQRVSREESPAGATLTRPAGLTLRTVTSLLAPISARPTESTSAPQIPAASGESPHTPTAVKARKSLHQ
jgi:hypothetical protein